MNHIDEGLAVLDYLDYDHYVTNSAYCIHPMLQTNEDLLLNYQNRKFKNLSPVEIITAMEYRHVANAYLSNRKIEGLQDIKLSNIDVVNNMLAADKIQNRKDFELYHKDTHPRSKELEEYFNNWLAVLGIDEKLYQEAKRHITLDYSII